MKIKIILFSSLFSLPLLGNIEEFNKGIEAFEKQQFNEAKNHLLHCLGSIPVNVALQVDAYLALGQIALAEKNPQEAEKYFKNAAQDNHEFDVGHINMHSHISKLYAKYGYKEKTEQHIKIARLLGEPTKNL